MLETPFHICNMVTIINGKVSDSTNLPLGSENEIGADNQQERSRMLKMEKHYIAGFVDGEGSFHIAFQRKKDVKLGWQVIPEFHISQNYHSKCVLEQIKQILKCGYIKSNHAKSKRDRTCVYVVRNRRDLLQKIIPFFNLYQLHTEKREDYRKFQFIVSKMINNEHLSQKGFSEIVEIAYSMNANGRYRNVKKKEILTSLKSSETICSASNLTSSDG